MHARWNRGGGHLRCLGSVTHLRGGLRGEHGASEAAAIQGGLGLHMYNCNQRYCKYDLAMFKVGHCHAPNEDLYNSHCLVSYPDRFSAAASAR